MQRHISWNFFGMMSRLGKVVFTAVFAFFIASCGDNDSNNSSSQNANNPNTTLSGHIFSVYQGWLWKMDLGTGRFVRIQGTDWENDKAYHNLASFLLSPAVYEGNEFILTVKNCTSTDTGCVVTLNESGMKTGQFVLSGEIRGAAKMSRDRQYVALTIQYGTITSDTYFEIYDRSGNRISSDVVGNTAVRLDFDWLPDGRLVYVTDEGDRRSVYLTVPYSAKVERRLRLPDTWQGVIRHAAVSPDGTKLAFSLVSDSTLGGISQAVPVILELESKKLWRLAIDPHRDDQQKAVINDPKWSPDGRWILVTYGGAGSAAPIGDRNPGHLPYLFAVPSDGVDVPLSPYDKSIDSRAIHIRSYWYAAFYDRPDSDFNIDRWPKMDYDWVL